MARPASNRRTFGASILSFIWLEWKTLRYYPSNLLLALVEGSVNTGIWLFIGIFLQDIADSRVAEFGGSYVSYVVIGVAFFEAAQTAIISPFQTISLAFWDKRLEAYHLARNGIWAHVLGRLLWQLGYAFAIQITIVAVIVTTIGIDFSPDANPLLALACFALFVSACFGLGLASASSFFLLEVKEGSEPIGWTATVLARVASGVYYPLAILPFWLQPLGWLVPHTYALRCIRYILIDGRGVTDGTVARDLAALAAYTAVSLSIGIWLLRRGLRRAERAGGLSVVG